jgi:hypothetical protein
MSPTSFLTNLQNIWERMCGLLGHMSSEMNMWTGLTLTSISDVIMQLRVVYCMWNIVVSQTWERKSCRPLHDKPRYALQSFSNEASDCIKGWELNNRVTTNFSKIIPLHAVCYGLHNAKLEDDCELLLWETALPYSELSHSRGDSVNFFISRCC